MSAVLPHAGFAELRPRPQVSLAEQLLALRRRWRVVAYCLCLIVGITLAGLARMTTTYTATGVILYDPDNAATPGDPLSTASDVANQDAVTASQGAVIASLPAAQLLVSQMHLAQLPAFNPGLRRRGWLARWLHRGTPPAAADAITAAVIRALDVMQVPNSRILNVSFTTADPVLAAQGANLAMQNYLDHERDQSFATLTDAQDWLEANSAQIQTGLDQTETALVQARATAGVVPGAQASLTTETVSRISASLVDAKADLAMNQARLSSAAAGDAAAANAAVAPNLLPLRTAQAELAAKVQSLSGEYGPDYPDLQAARASLAAISAEINAETAREMDAARDTVAADQAEIGILTSALATARGQSQSEDAESAPIRALEQREDAGRAMLRNMTLQADQLAQEASLTRPDARILSAATPPASPSSPHRGLILVASTGLGLCVGLLLAGLMDALDTSFRSGAALQAASGLNCLALLPEIRRPQTAARDAPFSVFAEQLRALQTGLCIGQKPSQVIAITAARPSEGKTTLTIALGRALAASGLRVLVIDGDIRQPSFDPVFNLGGAPGLTDHLAGTATLQAVIQRDPLGAMDVIGAGGRMEAALPLFLSPALAACFETLRGSYDIVLLDVPPAFALAEGRVLARMADGALLCVRWGKTPLRVVLGAMVLLQAAEVNLIGAALTRVNARSHRRSGFADAEIYQPRYGGYFR